MADKVRQANPHIREVKPGDPILAEQWNLMAGAVQRHGAHHANAAQNPGAGVSKMSEAVGPLDPSDVANAALYKERKAKLVSYNQNNTEWEEVAEIERENISDPMGLVWDKDEVVPVIHHGQTGNLIPLNARTTRIAKVVIDGAFPARDTTGNVQFPIKFIRAGDAAFTASDDNYASTDIDDSGADSDDVVISLKKTWLPPGQVIEVFNVIGPEGKAYWYTYYNPGSMLAETGGSGITSGSKATCTAQELSPTGTVQAFGTNAGHTEGADVEIYNPWNGDVEPNTLIMATLLDNGYDTAGAATSDAVAPKWVVNVENCPTS